MKKKLTLRRIITFVAFIALALGVPLNAFPPSPYYTLFGIVRDQVGQTVTADDVTLILLKDGKEVGRTPVTKLGLDQNYELNVRIDSNRAGTTLYKNSAVPAEGLFSLVVEMNGALFYPIEVAGNLTAGKGSERVRLDLNLGADSDLDGLPDVWEQWQLYQAGHFPNAQGVWDLSLIDHDGDFDGDGKSNYLEYLAGTFAGDETEYLDLDLKEKTETHVKAEFYVITGKTYTIERSTDAENWTLVPFAPDTVAAGVNSSTAMNVGIQTAYVARQNDKREFYRLTVR